jgi:hypothetical protein
MVLLLLGLGLDLSVVKIVVQAHARRVLGRSGRLDLMVVCGDEAEMQAAAGHSST